MSGAASLDLRLPIGGLFTALGILIAGYGFATNGSPIYAASLSININLWWGLVMLLMGIIMLILGTRAMRRHHPSAAMPAGETPMGRATERREHEVGLER
jgi:membrane protein implicated in regulation of membrane protease activity